MDYRELVLPSTSGVVCRAADPTVHLIMHGRLGLNPCKAVDPTVHCSVKIRTVDYQDEQLDRLFYTCSAGKYLTASHDTTENTLDYTYAIDDSCVPSFCDLLDKDIGFSPFELIFPFRDGQVMVSFRIFYHSIVEYISPHFS